MSDKLFDCTTTFMPRTPLAPVITDEQISLILPGVLSMPR